MSIAGLLAGTVILLLLITYVAAPFRTYNKRDSRGVFIQHQRDRVLVYYERALTNVRDLDEDYATGKIGAEEYQREREVWTQRGIDLLKLLDQLDAQGSLLLQPTSDEAAIDTAIEEAISAHRNRN